MPRGNPKKEPVLFISCGIFKEEIEYLIREKGLKADVLFLDAALHVNFDKLRSSLSEALKSRQKKGKKIGVIYGHCHPGIKEILGPFGAKRINAANCLEAIIGKEEIRRINSGGKTFFLTAGWVNNWERMFAMGREDLDLDFSKLFSDYKRIVVFDSGVIPIDEGKIDAFRRLTGLPVERRCISLDHLQKVISEI